MDAGERYGRWTVLGPADHPVSDRSAVLCRCDCGTERIVLEQSLQRKDRANPSCGCWKRERTATIVSETRWKNSHGRAASGKDPLYRLWLRINRRCHSPNADNYRWYGARGISVWEPWRHDAGAFIAYIEQHLGPRPDGMSLDRIDNDGNYEPGNLRWADALVQARNRRERSLTMPRVEMNWADVAFGLILLCTVAIVAVACYFADQRRVAAFEQRQRRAFENEMAAVKLPQWNGDTYEWTPESLAYLSDPHVQPGPDLDDWNSPEDGVYDELVPASGVSGQVHVLNGELDTDAFIAAMRASTDAWVARYATA